MLFSNDTDHGMSTSRGRFLKNLSWGVALSLR
jgi:hypothetical protein